MRVSSYPTVKQTVGTTWPSKEMTQPMQQVDTITGYMCCFRVDGWQFGIEHSTCAVLEKIFLYAAYT